MLKFIRSNEKETKLQWIQDPRETSGDNLNIIRHEGSIYFTNKKREYLIEDEINELAANIKNKNKEHQRPV
jgi:hypothetical protein